MFEKRRKIYLETFLKKIVTLMAKIYVNTETRRPYLMTAIEKSMKTVHFSINPNRNALGSGSECD